MTTNLRSNLHDIVCFSHLRWHFVFQRPQHLMSRFARERRVFFIEEPVYEADIDAYMAASHCLKVGCVCRRSALAGEVENRRGKVECVPERAD